MSGFGDGLYGGGGGGGFVSEVPVLGKDKLLIEDLDVNDFVDWFIADDPGFQFVPARKKLSWASSPLGDGAVLSGDEDHWENAEMIFAASRVVAGTTDQGLSALDQLQAKIQKARDIEGGLPVQWTPAGSSTPITYFMLDGEVEELRTGRLDGYPNAPTALCHLYLRPFGYGPSARLPLGISDPFTVNSITNGFWRYDVGAGTLSVVGALTPTDTTGKRIYRPSTIVNGTYTMRFHTGTTISGGLIGHVVKRLDASNRLVLRYTGTSNAVEIRKTTTAGGDQLLATAPVTLAASTWYWLQAVQDANDLFLAVYPDNQAPLTTEDPVALAQVAYTLAGAEITQFGDDGTNATRGNPGITFTPADLTWSVDQWNLTNTFDVRNADPILGFEVHDVPGHVPAEATLNALEGSSQARSHFEWGLECRSFRPDLMPPILIDSDALVTGGFAGTQTGSGQYDPDSSGNSAITVNKLSRTVPLAACGTGNQFHLGPHKVKAHVKGDPGVRIRLAWRESGGTYKRNDYCSPLTGVDWQEIDLGTINVPETDTGVQRWDGRLEALGDVGAFQAIIDYVLVIPVERYGVARAPMRPIVPTTYAALDHFDQTNTNVNGAALVVAPADGLWHTSGAPVDYFIDTANHWMYRFQLSDADLDTGRYAVVGTTNFGPVQVRCDIRFEEAPNDDRNLDQKWRGGVMLSWQSATNWVMAVRQLHSVGHAASGNQDADYDHSTVLRIFKRVSGTVTQLGFKYEHVPPSVNMTLVAQMDQTGTWSVTSFPAGTKQPAEPTMVGQDADLAGGLQNGRIGIYDACTENIANMTRIYENFIAFTPVIENVVGAGRTLQIQPDEAVREVTGGLGTTFFGPVPMYRSARGLYVPPAGDEQRVSRVAVKMRRADVDGGLPDSNPASDAATYSVDAQARYLTPPGVG